MAPCLSRGRQFESVVELAGLTHFDGESGWLWPVGFAKKLFVAYLFLMSIFLNRIFFSISRIRHSRRLEKKFTKFKMNKQKNP